MGGRIKRKEIIMKLQNYKIFFIDISWITCYRIPDLYTLDFHPILTTYLTERSNY